MDEIKLRQVVPLALLYAAEDNVIKGRTKMQKFAFFVEEDLEQEGMDLDEAIDLDFYPYDYGPFSKQLLEDLEWLEDKDAIDIKKTRSFSSKRYDYYLEETGEDLFEVIRSDDRVEKIKSVADEVIEEYGSWSTRKILDHIYEEFPHYRENSVYY